MNLKRSPRRGRCLVLALVAFVIAALVVIAGRDTPPNANKNPPADSAPVVKAPEVERPRNGELARLDCGPDADVWVSVDGKAQDELTTFANAKNEAAVRQMMQQGRIMVCAHGTRVTVIDRGAMTTGVRIMEGKWEGRSGIVPAEFVRK